MSFAEAQNPATIATKQNLSQLFSEQASISPAKVALIAGEEKFSYQQLDQRANQLASFLLNQGVGPETLVGVLLDRKPEMLIAVLAVLKAGAAYVPLDPAYPAERIGYIVQDAEISILLSSNRLQHAATGVPRPPDSSPWKILALSNRMKSFPKPILTISPTSSTPPAQPESPKG